MNDSNDAVAFFEKKELVWQTGKAPCVVNSFMSRTDFFPFDGSKRQFDVILPPAYDAQKKYPVLFMYDGQNLFREVDGWNAPQTAARLADSGVIPPVVIVGLYHGGIQRGGEYFPQDAWNCIPEEIIEKTKEFAPQGCMSNLYLDWAVHTVKPYVFDNFSVTRDKDFVFIAGSSMGALMALNACLTYPEEFGGAGCLSTHWRGCRPPFPAVDSYLIDWVKKEVCSASLTNAKFYFDHGDGNGNLNDLDAGYGPSQNKIDAIMRKNGYQESLGNYKSISFEHAAHHEKFWSERFADVLEFLLKQRD